MSLPNPSSRFWIVAAVVAGVLALAQWFPNVLSVLLLLFGGIVLAVLLDAIALGVRKLTGIPRGPSLAVMALLVAALLAGLVLLIAPQLAYEVPKLIQRLPEAWAQLRDQLNDTALLGALLAQIDSMGELITGGGVLGRVANMLSNTAAGLFNAFVIVFVASYLVVDPARYQKLAQRALPRARREQTGQLIPELGQVLRHWLLGRGCSMAVVGISITAGLLLLNVPLATTLGLIAGLLSFIPYLGPILALAPALLIAATQSLPLAGWVLVLFAGVQIAESYLITPLILQRAVSMLPAVLIIAQLLGGVLAGLLGILLAAPLVVVAGVALRRL